MKFSEINSSIIGKNVELVSLKNSKLEENDIIQKNKIYSVFNIDKNFQGQNNLTIELIDDNFNVFWVNHYDIEIVE